MMPVVQYVRVNCCKCGEAIWMTADRKAWYQADSRRSFHCLAGHAQHFSNEDNDVDAMRRERDRLRQRQAQLDDKVRYERRLREAAERQASARKGQITKLRKRASAGVCPCCTRSFQNLRQHMANQHPKFLVEEV